jgi:tryptophan synthase alpha chain
MDRIAEQFARARQENRACFVAYVCAGDPDFETSLEVCRTLVDGNIDVLELGVPFSDPLADGLTNQLAAQRALASGMTAERVFELVREVRKFTQIPIVFYTYYNLVFSNGIENYIRRAREAGVDGMLTLDLPPEEADEVLEVCRRQEMKNIFIVAPTTPAARLGRIAAAASGFIYYVSREGVTGVRQDLAGNIGEAVAEIKKNTELPVVVGFGISSREQVQQIAAVSDGVVVGSALVNCVKDHLGNPEEILTSLRARLEELVAGVKR